MFNLIPIPAFNDNYIWMLHDGERALIVDPGQAEPVLQILKSHNLQLETILITHHHMDHCGGVDELRKASGAKVFGAANETMPEPCTPLNEGDTLVGLGLEFSVIDVPGHTSGHIAFYAHNIDGLPLLFCGDTLFSGGCGRLFEGTPAQMLTSLDKLALLPAATRVCCAHEYTLSNLRFARSVEPENTALAQYQSQCIALREAGQPTLPSTMGMELSINPFLRTREPALVTAAQQVDTTAQDDISVFAVIRQLKNNF
jgi:hydroxyacylglutathione hydrolase